MRKLQCEACNGRIMKVSDAYFECQSCGLQYSLESIKNSIEVSIDHSQEISNLNRRALDYEKAKNFPFAKDYYNKVLDLDSVNITALEGLERIKKEEKYSNLFIVKSNVLPQQNIESFKRLLKQQKDIERDIYKEIKIINASASYIVIYEFSGQVRGEWSGTACHNHREAQTVYKREYDSNLHREVNRPTTEYVTKVDRVPVSGTSYFNVDFRVLSSAYLSRKMMGIEDSQVTDIMQKFTKNINNISDLTLIPLESGDVQTNYIFNTYKDNVPIDFEEDANVREEMIDYQMDDEYDRMRRAVRGKIHADKVENLNLVCNFFNSNEKKILLPVQIINYVYKDENYIAVFDLVTEEGKVITYPIDESLEERRQKLKKLKLNLKYEGLGLGVSLFLYIIAIAAQSEVMTGFFLMIVFAVSIVFLVDMIDYTIKSLKYKSYVLDYKRDMDSSYGAFFQQENI